MESGFRVLMFPWLAHGHISPYLHLAKKLANKGVHIYFCSTPVNLISIKKKLSSSSSSSSSDANNNVSIQLVEFNLQSLPQLPPHHHTAIGLPPHLIPTLFQAMKMSSSSFSQILNNIKPDLIIYDILIPWLPDLAKSYRVPAIHFQCSGAAALAFVYWSVKNPTLSFPYSNIYLTNAELKKMNENSLVAMEGKEGLPWFEQSDDIVLMRTSREIEEKYIDMYSVLSDKRIVLVGSESFKYTDEADGEFRHIFRWLDMKEEYSIVFVSFGTESYLSKKELEELAYGLELSNVNFIWVLRFPAEEYIGVEDALPEGFVNRVKERGLVLDGWAPQTKILEHKSVGGFVSHCGWSSVLESINFGVPIIAVPMHNDQPLNARLAVENGVCLEVLRDENLQFGRQEVARVVLEVVTEEIGQKMRRKAKELSVRMSMEGEEEIDGVVEELKRICIKNM